MTRRMKTWCNSSSSSSTIKDRHNLTRQITIWQRISRLTCRMIREMRTWCSSLIRGRIWGKNKGWRCSNFWILVTTLCLQILQQIMWWLLTLLALISSWLIQTPLTCCQIQPPIWWQPLLPTTAAVATILSWALPSYHSKIRDNSNWSKCNKVWLIKVMVLVSKHKTTNFRNRWRRME